MPPISAFPRNNWLWATWLSRQLARSLCTITFLLTVLTGCNMNDPMIQEMETAYATAGEAKSLKHEEKQEERKRAVSLAVQKYFPVGMRAEDAFKRLQQMKEQGYEVREYRRNGARIWPDGEFKPYHEDIRRSIQRRYPNDVSGYTATKDYGMIITLLVTKHVSVSFRVIDGSGMISEVRGDIGTTGP